MQDCLLCMAFCCFWQQEYLFMPKLMIAKNRKGNNMDTGLLSMYVALMLLGLGMIVFSKIEDNKKGK